MDLRSRPSVFKFFFQQFKAKTKICVEAIKMETLGSKIRKRLIAQRGARTHDPEIKSLMLYRLS